MFSLLSTAGTLSEAAFYDRISSQFVGHDLPDEALVQACLDSYRSASSTTDRLATTDDLLERSQEHTELLGALADGGHRMGLRVWLSNEQVGRRLGRGVLGDVLHERERYAYLGGISRSTDELAEVDCVWYIRGKLAFLFEVEWTAMLAEPLLRKHARSRRTSGSSDSSSSRPSGRTSSATSSPVRRCCAPPSRRARGTS